MTASAQCKMCIRDRCIQEKYELFVIVFMCLTEKFRINFIVLRLRTVTLQKVVNSFPTFEMFYISFTAILDNQLYNSTQERKVTPLDTEILNLRLSSKQTSFSV